MTSQTFPDRLADLDFAAHNAEVREVLGAFSAKRPIRVPMVVGTNTRYFMFDPKANPEGVDFEPYSNDPDLMYETSLGFQRWSRFNLLQDVELGMPERWSIGVDFQNYSEAAWFGCEVRYFEQQVPDTMPDFADDPERVMEQGIPDPFGGIYAKALEFYERMKERGQREGYLGKPVDIVCPGNGTDGPLTIACNLFGPDFVFEAMADEPERLETLLRFVTDGIVARMSAWRKFAGIDGRSNGFWMADDSVALISTPMYVEHVLPLHRMIYDAFATEQGRGIHLCGNATRHFKSIVDELGIEAFDTGFPVDFGGLRKQLGPDILIQGGPHVEFLRTKSPDEVYEESKRILLSGVLEGGRFLLREGNNLAPGTPLENVEAMRKAAKDFGKYRGE